jgi:GNAT superfamily N-acetyltransferase
VTSHYPDRRRRQEARFGRGYRESAALADGSTVYLRRLRRGDSPLVVQVFERLSPEARYQRFFSHKQALSTSDLKALTDCEGEHHLAIVALTKVAGAEEGIGVARFVRLRDDPLTAEIALAVVDAHQRKGIGRLLLRRLTEAASERGIRQLLCFVLPTNLPMTALVRQLAPEAKQDDSASHGAAFSTLVFKVPLRRQASA